MEVEKSGIDAQVMLSKIPIGGCFIYSKSSDVYMKCEHHLDELTMIVSLQSGKVFIKGCNCYVIPVKAKVIVSYYNFER